MKKIIIILLILIPQIIISQNQYISTSLDVKNAIIGSAPTLNNPSIDILINGGLQNRKGFTIEVGYESFKKINFSKYSLGIGYTFKKLENKLWITALAEPTVIIRNWDNDWGEMSYLTLGTSLKISYFFYNNLGLIITNNALLRVDNEDRYNIKTPKVYSIYGGIIYKFK